ncbi:MAG TPA: hypothetical protein EYP90_07065 [Chromatiaceae bacterium]|nr:hypothetical protein [Chromatiaceae bacterium]
MGKNFPAIISVTGRFFPFKAHAAPADNNRDAHGRLKDAAAACPAGCLGFNAVQKEDRLILEKRDCVLEIGRCAFSVTQISKDMVRFFRSNQFIACGRVTGRLNFGRGVSFAVSGSVGILKGGQAVLRDVRVVAPATDGEEAFWVSEPLPPAETEGYGDGGPARRCA